MVDTSPKVMRLSFPASVFNNKAPSSSRPANSPRHTSLPVVTVSGDPSGMLCDSHPCLSCLNPSFAARVLNAALAAWSNFAHSALGVVCMPFSRRLVEGRPAISGALSIFTPKPRTPRYEPLVRAVVSTSIPAHLAFSMRRSLGHLRIGGLPADREAGVATALMASARALPASSDICVISSASHHNVRSRLACRFPERLNHWRPIRPRPAVWRSARIQRGPTFPFAPMRSASTLVEPISPSCMTGVCGQVAKGSCMPLKGAANSPQPPPQPRLDRQVAEGQMRR